MNGTGIARLPFSVAFWAIAKAYGAKTNPSRGSGNIVLM
jgi:hypothetical protein